MKVILVVARGKASNADDPYYTDSTAEVICVAASKEKALYQAKKWLWIKYNSLEEYYGDNRQIDPKYGFTVRGGGRYDYESYKVTFESVELI